MDATGSLNAALAGRYAVERELGRGGMATVYAAEDLRHRRRVAVKVLHPELGTALGPERFLREIRVTANLHHPHILPLHDSGEADGLLYYVMPLVEGESLRDRLVRERQLPVDEAVRITLHVAAALDYAHRHGVVHRDLKPENVLLQDGEAVVADFGVARAVARAADADTLTGTGVSVGTPHYMSPEQAAGEREVDGRSDVFSLGCVLYEMLAGTPPFTAPSAQGVVAKVMAEQPRPLAAERHAVPPHVAAAVARALEKLPADRFATAAQFAAALVAPAGTQPSGTVPSAGAPAAATARGRRALRPTWRDAAWAALGGALGGALVVLVLGAAARRAAQSRSVLAAPVRFTLAIPDSQRLVADVQRAVAISPDGRAVVYAGQARQGGRMLYLRPLEELTARPIAGSEGAFAPFFSPDGRSVGFYSAGGIRKVPVNGGAAVTVSPLAPIPLGLAWGPKDVIVMGSTEGLFRVPAAGGTPERLTVVDEARGEQAHTVPRFLSDGRTVAFRISMSGGIDPSQIGLVSVDEPPAAGGRGAPVTRLEGSGGTPLGYAEGMLIVGRPDGAIVAVPVDVRRRRANGEPVPVLDRVLWNSGGGGASLAGDGTLVYLSGSDVTRLALADERGAVTGGLDEPRRYRNPRVSPDGRRVALHIASGAELGADIWVYDLTSGVLSRLTARGWSTRPAWTADGKHVAYVVEGTGRPSELWWVPADGSGSEELLYAMPGGLGIREVTFSPDGRFAVFRTGTGGGPTRLDLWLLPLDGGGERRATPLVQTPFNEAMPRVSPDGRWLAYVSDESGRYEVFVRPFPGPGGRVQLSDGGGAEPVWAADGRRLFYRAGERFVAVTLAAVGGSAGGAPNISATNRRVLFDGAHLATLPIVAPPQYDVLPDGRFVVLPPESEDREVVVILDWLVELRARIAEARRR